MTEVPTFRPTATIAPTYVRGGETILWTGRPTLALLFSQAVILGVMLLFLSSFVLNGRVGQGLGIVQTLPGIVATLFVFLIVWNLLRLRRTEFVVTEQGVYTRTGVIGQSVVQTTYDKITDIGLKQDILGRLLGYASLAVNTAGSNQAPIRMEGLRQAQYVKDRIETARDAFLARRRGGAPRGRTNIPVFVPAEDLVTLTCPTARKRYRRPKAEVGSIAPCPHCKKTHPVRVGGSRRGRTRS